jgi:hypothetical protein
MSIKAVIAVDERTDFNVFVPISEEKPLVLWRLIIEGNTLDKERVLDLATKAGQQQTINLDPGVYFVITARTLEYQPSKHVRVAINGGKDPWPVPPKAPVGSDLAANVEIYNAQFSEFVKELSAGGSTAWIALTSQPTRKPQTTQRSNGKKTHATPRRSDPV